MFNEGISTGDGIDRFPTSNGVKALGIAIVKFDTEDLGKPMTDLSRP